MSDTLNDHIEVTLGVSGGSARIAGRRITVRDVVIWHERLARTPDEIAADHELTLADVYAALAYYFDHRDEIDRSIEADQAFVQALREQTPSKLTMRLRDLRGGD